MLVNLRGQSPADAVSRNSRAPTIRSRLQGLRETWEIPQKAFSRRTCAPANATCTRRLAFTPSHLEVVESVGGGLGARPRPGSAAGMSRAAAGISAAWCTATPPFCGPGRGDGRHWQPSQGRRLFFTGGNHAKRDHHNQVGPFTNCPEPPPALPFHHVLQRTWPRCWKGRSSTSRPNDPEACGVRCAWRSVTAWRFPQGRGIDLCALPAAHGQ